MATVIKTFQQHAPEADQCSGKYLTFLLGSQEFGIRVGNVRGIMGLQEITTVANAPPDVTGVINLRDNAIPVVDLGLKFELDDRGDAARTCVIVVSVETPGGAALTGIIVDGVCEVLQLAAHDIEDPSGLGACSERWCLLGMATVKGKVKILLDIDRALASEDLTRLRDAAS